MQGGPGLKPLIYNFPCTGLTGLGPRWTDQAARYDWARRLCGCGLTPGRPLRGSRRHQAQPLCQAELALAYWRIDSSSGNRCAPQVRAEGWQQRLFKVQGLKFTNQGDMQKAQDRIQSGELKMRVVWWLKWLEMVGKTGMLLPRSRQQPWSDWGPCFGRVVQRSLRIARHPVLGLLGRPHPPTK